MNVSTQLGKVDLVGTPYASDLRCYLHNSKRILKSACGRDYSEYMPTYTRSTKPRLFPTDKKQKKMEF